MPTFYQRLTPEQEPFELPPLDEYGRLRYAFNVYAHKNPSVDPLAELAARLIDQGVGTSANIFQTGKRSIPIDDGPYLQIRETGGVEPERTHNGDKYPRPDFQIVVRGKNSEAVVAMARAAHSALDAFNVTL